MTACASVCVRVKCCLTQSTCLLKELALLQNVKRQDRKFQAQRDVQSRLVPDASMRGAVVSRVCTRRSTRHADSDHEKE